MFKRVDIKPLPLSKLEKKLSGININLNYSRLNSKTRKRYLNSKNISILKSNKNEDCKVKLLFEFH